MARHSGGIRYLPPPGAIVEITMRTLHSRFFLAPTDEEVNELVLGVLGRALSLHPGILLFAFTVLSNHYHLLLFAPDAKTLASFESHLNGNLARVMNRKLGRRERFWGRRYASIRVIDPLSQVNRLRYVLAQGCKEGLIAKPQDWPGASSTLALLEGRELWGKWYDRTALWSARHNGRKASPEDFVRRYKITLAPLPCWADLPESERRAQIREIVGSIEAQTAEENTRLHRTPLGPERIRKQSPRSKPAKTKWSPAPLCHASGVERAGVFREEYTAAVVVYQDASERIRKGDETAHRDIPRGCFPPPMPFKNEGPDAEKVLEETF